MDVPSGRILSASDLNLLRDMAEVGFVRHSDTPFKLKSGIMSHVYVYGREDLTDNTKLEWSVGGKICDIVDRDHYNDRRTPCLIGIPTAGNALAQAAAMVSLTRVYRFENRSRVMCHRIMREQLKAYGAHKAWVNGAPDIEKHSYWMVDNVATDGKSKEEAAEKLIQDGYDAHRMPCLIWIDRQQGAVARLERVGFKKVIVAFNLLDITHAYGELNLWPKEAVRAVEEEIQQHQVL